MVLVRAPWKAQVRYFGIPAAVTVVGILLTYLASTSTLVYAWMAVGTLVLAMTIPSNPGAYSSGTVSVKGRTGFSHVGYFGDYHDDVALSKATHQVGTAYRCMLAEDIEGLKTTLGVSDTQPAGDPKVLNTLTELTLRLREIIKIAQGEQPWFDGICSWCKKPKRVRLVLVHGKAGTPPVWKPFCGDAEDGCEERVTLEGESNDRAGVPAASVRAVEVPA